MLRLHPNKILIIAYFHHVIHWHMNISIVDIYIVLISWNGIVVQIMLNCHVHWKRLSWFIQDLKWMNNNHLPALIFQNSGLSQPGARPGDNNNSHRYYGVSHIYVKINARIVNWSSSLTDLKRILFHSVILSYWMLN